MLFQTIMETVFKKANRKAVAALKKKIKCSDSYGRVNNPKVRRYWKDRYIRVLWEHMFNLANDKSTDETGPISEARESITNLLQSSLPYPITVSKNSHWTTIKLANLSYLLCESEDGLVISATMPAAKLLSKLSDDEASRLIIAFDGHIASAEQIAADTLKAYMNEKKASEVLHTAASAILSDLLATEKNVWFNISLQKNGRLCCRVMEYADWLPGKTFRTTWDNLRVDFAEALKDLRTRREFGKEL